MEHTDQATSPENGLGAFEPPAGDHPLEVAARRGIGPLSPAGSNVWHGHAMPCVSCGQLVGRGTAECADCGQDLSEEMMEKMRAHAGPWYVLEHLRPFPGVSLDRIIKQIRRGLITEVSIVRGPATDYQWRFAAETPGLCRYFGRCWHCHHAVSMSDAYCPACLSHLTFERPSSPAAATHIETPSASAGVARTGTPSSPRPEGPAARPAEPTRPGAPAHPQATGAAAGTSPGAPPGAPGSSAELDKLARVVGSARPTGRYEAPQAQFGPVRAAWIVVALLMLAVLGLLWIVNARSRSLPASPPPVVKSLE